MATVTYIAVCCMNRSTLSEFDRNHKNKIILKETKEVTMPPAKGATTTWTDEFNKIWNKMMTRKDSEFFREPVPWKELNLLDYPHVIKKPMDLTTIKKNQEAGVYKKPADIAIDVRLIFENAMTYNMPDSKVYVHAKSLGEFFENAWANVPSAFITAEDILDRPPSGEALADFVEKCHRISADELGEVLKHLDKLCPNALVKVRSTLNCDHYHRSYTSYLYKNRDLIRMKWM